MKTNRKLTNITAVLMAVLMVLCAMAITGCAGEDNPKEKSEITETKKTPEQIAAEKKVKAEAEQKAREEAEKKAKEAEEKAKKAAEEKAKQEQALIKQNADQKKYHIFIKKSHDFGDGKGEIKGAYGPWFISLDTDAMSKGAWGGIGIHGTHKPNVMRVRDSEGCIRLQNRNVEELKQYVRVGTKVVIEE